MSDSRAPHILVTNVVALNGGDAAILESLVRGLRRRLGDSLRFTVMSAQADVAARYYGYLDVQFREPLSRLVTRAGRKPATRVGRMLERDLLRRLSAARYSVGSALRAAGGPAFLLGRAERAIVELYDEADFVIGTGGTYLVENYAIAPRVLDFRAAMRAGKPLALYTQSMGPFGPRSARVLRPVFDYARLILARDAESLEHVRATGAAVSRTTVAADGAFTLGDEASVAAARVEQPRAGALRVAASIRDWPFFRSKPSAQGMRDLTDAFGALARHVAARHRGTLTFSSTCEGIPEYWKDDARTARGVLASLDPVTAARVTVDGRFRTPLELMQHYRGFDVVVAMRMHAAILALAAGVPVIPVAYEPKQKSLFQRLGFADWLLDVESVDGAALIGTFDRVVRELPARRAALFEAVGAEMRSAAHGLDLLAQAVGAASGPRT